MGPIFWRRTLSLSWPLNQRPALLEREDCTLTAWYRSLYAPRTGGAYDSHHQTTGTAGRTRRRVSRVAPHRARAAAIAGDRIYQWRVGRCLRALRDRVPRRPQRNRFCGGPERGGRVTTG